MVKGTTTPEIFKIWPPLKKQLWGGAFWTEGYLANWVGKKVDEDMKGREVKNQGKK